MCDILCFVVVIGGSGGRMGFLKPFYVHFFYVFKNAILKTYIYSNVGKYYKGCMVKNIEILTTLVDLLNNELHRKRARLPKRGLRFG